MSFLSQWKFLKSVNHVGVWVLGQGWNSCPFNQGLKCHWVTFLSEASAGLTHSLWLGQQKWFLPKLGHSWIVCLILHGGWLFRTSLSCGHRSYREEEIIKENLRLWHLCRFLGLLNYYKFGALKQQKWLLFFYWRIVDLQCCVSFKCTGKWLRFLFHYRLLYQT